MNKNRSHTNGFIAPIIIDKNISKKNTRNELQNGKKLSEKPKNMPSNQRHHTIKQPLHGHKVR